MKKIPLINSTDFALVDDSDFDYLSKFRWGKQSRGYVRAWTGKTVFYLHRLIMGASKGQEVDHIDKNKLNNQKSNLRFCTRSQNNANVKIRDYNTSGYKGVSFDKSRGKFLARITVLGKEMNLGRFFDARDAANAYDVAAKKYYGEFAHLNNVQEEANA